MPAERTLGQVIAVEKTTRKKDNDEGARIQNALVRQGAVNGSIKTYKSDMEEPPPSEQIAAKILEVRARAEDALKEARRYSVPAMDITATKDATNQAAVADLMAGGVILVPAVPISHLLWLEDYLQQWRNFLAKLPTLDPTVRWRFDEGQGLYESVPEETMRMVKEETPLVLLAPTKEHAGQVKTIMKETPAGKYTTIAQSGAITEQRKQQLLDRMHTLQLATKDAISRANKTSAVEVREGDAIMDFLLS